MSEALVVRWTIRAQEPPQPLLHCTRCGGTRRHRSSDRIRVNANGKRVDAWLIYRCTCCDGTWNRPVLERQPVRSIDPPLLASLLANDATLARRLAFDGEALKRWAPRLRDASGAVVGREVLSGGTAQPGELRILCVVPYPLALRLDRLLADELRLSRSRIQALAGSGTLMAFPAASRILRRPVRDGMTVLIRLPIPDAEAMVDAAAGADACPMRGQA